MKQEDDELDAETFIAAASLGAVAGLRAMMAPALFSGAASFGENNEFENNFLASPKISVALALLAAGELIGDKLPSTPNRTELPGLSARIVSGAIVGGSICAARKKSVLMGVVVGAISSVAAAYAGQNIRHEIADRSGINSSVLGAIEDVIAVGIGINALKSKK